MPPPSNPKAPKTSVEDLLPLHVDDSEEDDGDDEDLSDMSKTSKDGKVGANVMLPFIYSLYAVYLNSAGEFKTYESQIKEVLLNPSDSQLIDKLLDPSSRKIFQDAAVGARVELRPLGRNLLEVVKDAGTFLPEQSLGLLKAFGAFFRNGNERAFAAIRSATVSPAIPSWIRKALKSTHRKPEEIRQQLENIVFKFTGRKGEFHLSRQEETELGKSDKALQKEFKSLKKQYSDSWAAEATNYIRESGFHTVPAKELTDFLESQGFEHDLIPGFTGHYDGRLKMYNEHGVPVSGSIQSRAIKNIVMNTKKDFPYYFTAIPRDPEAGVKHYYLRDFALSRTAKKYQKVKDLIQHIDHARQVWLNGIKLWTPTDARCTAAVILELAYRFAARTGTRTQETYGITTARCKHIQFKGDAFVLKYVGKAGVTHANKMIAKSAMDKQIVSVLKALVANKQPDDLIFTYEDHNGVAKPVPAATVNHTLDKVTDSIGFNSRTTIKDFRTLIGTRMFLERSEQLMESTDTLDSPALLEKIRAFSLDVGEVLNHMKATGDSEGEVTGLTSLRNYIDLSAQKALFEHYDLPLPPYLLKLAKEEGLEHMRASVSQLLTSAAEDTEGSEDPTPKEGSKTEEKKEAPSEDKKPEAPPKKTAQEEPAAMSLMTADEESDLLQEILQDPTNGEDR